MTEKNPIYLIQAVLASAPMGRRSTRGFASYAVRVARRFTVRKFSDAHPDRREPLNLLKIIAPGDVMTVTRSDRLARSTFELFAKVTQIVGARGQFRSLAE